MGSHNMEVLDWVVTIWRCLEWNNHNMEVLEWVVTVWRCVACVITRCVCVVDGAVPRDLQEVLPGQTQWSQAAVAADPGPLCTQGRLSHGGYTRDIQ